MLNYKLHQPVRRKPKLTISTCSFPFDLPVSFFYLKREKF
jgi:hypothetical protein